MYSGGECPLCQNDRCVRPQGDENEVRKCDKVILGGIDELKIGDLFR
jgi:hypothetical protein